MGDRATGYFWRGPVVTRRRADRIINWAGGVPLGIGAAFGLVTAYGFIGMGNVHNLIRLLQPTAMFAGPGLALLILRHRWAAVAVVASGAITIFMSVSMLYVLVADTQADGAGHSSLMLLSAYVLLSLLPAALGVAIAGMGWRARAASLAIRSGLAGERAEAFE